MNATNNAWAVKIEDVAHRIVVEGLAMASEKSISGVLNGIAGHQWKGIKCLFKFYAS